MQEEDERETTDTPLLNTVPCIAYRVFIVLDSHVPPPCVFAWVSS